jgi:hypothetical protein
MWIVAISIRGLLIFVDRMCFDRYKNDYTRDFELGII